MKLLRLAEEKAHLLRSNGHRDQFRSARRSAAGTAGHCDSRYNKDQQQDAMRNSYRPRCGGGPAQNRFLICKDVHVRPVSILRPNILQPCFRHASHLRHALTHGMCQREPAQLENSSWLSNLSVRRITLVVSYDWQMDMQRPRSTKPRLPLRMGFEMSRSSPNRNEIDSIWHCDSGSHSKTHLEIPIEAAIRETRQQLAHSHLRRNCAVAAFENEDFFACARGTLPLRGIVTTNPATI